MSTPFFVIGSEPFALRHVTLQALLNEQEEMVLSRGPSPAPAAAVAWRDGPPTAPGVYCASVGGDQRVRRAWTTAGWSAPWTETCPAEWVEAAADAPCADIHPDVCQAEAAAAGADALIMWAPVQVG